MTKKFEFFYDLGSPYSYLAATQIEGLEKRHNIECIWRPILLGGLFKQVDNKSPFYETSINKKAHLLSDLISWADYYAVPFKLPSCFPPNTLMAMRGAVVANKMGLLTRYTHEMFRAYFVEDQNISEEEVLTNTLEKMALNSAEFCAELVTADVKQTLIENTQEAERRGAFGVPTFFYGQRMFFGNDRMILLENLFKCKT